MFLVILGYYEVLNTIIKSYILLFANVICLFRNDDLSCSHFVQKMIF